MPVGGASLSVAQSSPRQTIRAYPANYKPSQTSTTIRTQAVQFRASQWLEPPGRSGSTE